MRRAWLVPLILACVASAWLLTTPATGSSAVPGEDLVTKEAKGFKFKVPADWAVEERGGTVAPIPVEEYLSKKFSAVTARFEAVEKRLSTVETQLGELEHRVSGMDQRAAAVDQRVTAAERTQGEQGRMLREVQEQMRQKTENHSAGEDVEHDLVPRQPIEEGR